MNFAVVVTQCRTNLSKCILVEQEYESPDDVSHVLIHMDSRPPNYEIPIVKYGSEYIKIHLAAHLRALDEQALVRFFKVYLYIFKKVESNTLGQ